MADKHSPHTGKREIFISGVPQIRQSDGNTVVNRAVATSYNPEVKENGDRLSSAFPLLVLPELFLLLLKTTLPRSAVAAEAPAEPNLLKYSGAESCGAIVLKYRK